MVYDVITFSRQDIHVISLVYDKCVKDANGYGFPDVAKREGKAASTKPPWPAHGAAECRQCRSHQNHCIVVRCSRDLEAHNPCLFGPGPGLCAHCASHRRRTWRAAQGKPPGGGPICSPPGEARRPQVAVLASGSSSRPASASAARPRQRCPTAAA